jgi:uracil phosphoribosyltransferase
MRGADGHVTGARSAGSKIGGSIAGATVLIPDPMGATGSTTIEVVEQYRSVDAGAPRAWIAMHLMVTPEYLRRVLPAVDGLFVIAGRLDRGLSPKEILNTVPGTHPEQERGLDDNEFIVPGAGGLGEVLNNSWC